jgi:hypothetical protein
MIVEPTQIVVIQQPQTNIQVQSSGGLQVLQPPDTSVIISPGPMQILDVGTQGPAGPAGSGSEITGTCGITIAAGKACVLVDGLLYPADPTDVSQAGLYVGVSLTGGTMGQTITVAQLGVATTSGLIAGDRYFVGPSGALSTNPIAVNATWMRYIGTAQSSSTLILVSSVSVTLD